MTNEPLILCENLVKIYKLDEIEIVALQGLDMKVQPGEVMAIIGSSGSGKSTLLNVLGGLDRPSAGKVIVAGNDLLKLSDRQQDQYRRRYVGFIWQQKARNLIPYLNTEQNVELPMIMNGVGSGERREWARELIDAVGLSHRRFHRLAQMSGGEQQRVAIAVALANRPAILLGDEPTGELDSHTAEVVFEIFHNLNRMFGLTVMIVSHDPQIARFVDRVVAIRDGKTSSEIRRSEASTAANANGEQGSAETEHKYEELVVLDSVGRLQVPKEIRERYNIGDRIKIEETADGILIRPVEGAAPIAVKRLTEVDEPPPERAGRFQKMLGGLRRKR
jgi:putative ABC transport system ATP-binding protein